MLKGDKRAIFQAAAHAERAVVFLTGFQPQTEAEVADGEKIGQFRAAA